MIRRTLKSLHRYLRTPAARSAEEFGNEIEEEISFHLAQRASEYMAGGMCEEDARHKALERFGNASRYAAQCHLATVRGLATWHRLHFATTIALVVAVTFFGFRSTRPSADSNLEFSQLPPGIASMLDNDWTGDVRGRLVDERGQPITSAHVLVVVKTWPDESYFQRAYTAISGPDGGFLIENVHPIDEQYAVQIAAVADNRVLKSSYHQLAGGSLKPLQFELPASSGFGLKVEDSQGVTFSGVEVLPHGRVEADGHEHIVYFDSAQPIIRVTNADGRVELPYFQPGDTAAVMLRVPNGKWESHEVIVPAAGEDATVRASAHRELQYEES
jgi:hypothetical protein